MWLWSPGLSHTWGPASHFEDPVIKSCLYFQSSLLLMCAWKAAGDCSSTWVLGILEGDMDRVAGTWLQLHPTPIVSGIWVVEDTSFFFSRPFSFLLLSSLPYCSILFSSLLSLSPFLPPCLLSFLSVTLSFKHFLELYYLTYWT